MSEDVIDRVTNRWAGVDAVAWAAIAVGLFAREPAVLLLAGVGVVFSTYARLGTPPQPDLQVTRELDDPTPDPGQELTVRLTVTNNAGRLLPDVRIVDGVPDACRIVTGSPHIGTVLRAGESQTHTYTVQATHGTHEFEPTTIVCRTLNGTHEVEVSHDVETTITCHPAMHGASTPPLRSLVAQYSGQIPTDTAGSGVEFYGVRDYRPGDPVNRINWARRARTGELTTLEFRETRMATVVLLIDARDEAYVQSNDTIDTHAVEWNVRAAAETFAGLHDDGNQVGIAAIGTEFVWLAPGTGDVHRQRARDTLGMHPALSPSSPHERIYRRKLSRSTPELSRPTTQQFRHLMARLPANAQVFFFSPLVDEAAVTLAKRLQAANTTVTTISPDITTTGSAGTRLARLQRHQRITALRRADVRVIDWQLDDPLTAAFERAQEDGQ